MKDQVSIVLNLLIYGMGQWATQQPRAEAFRQKQDNNPALLPSNASAATAVASVADRAWNAARRTRGAAKDDDRTLLRATAALSLETAKKVRSLSAVALRTIAIPDACALGAPLLNAHAATQILRMRTLGHKQFCL